MKFNKICKMLKVEEEHYKLFKNLSIVLISKMISLLKLYCVLICKLIFPMFHFCVF